MSLDMEKFERQYQKEIEEKAVQLTDAMVSQAEKQRREKNQASFLKKLFIIIASLLFLLNITVVVVSTFVLSTSDWEQDETLKQEATYLHACSLLKNNNYSDAYFEFLNIQDYKDVGDILTNTPLLDPKRIVGAIFTFGTFEQDNDLSNGAEPIEWITIEASESKAEALALHGLYGMSHTERRTDEPSWAKSKINQWLQTEFVPKSFSAEEKANIISVNLVGGGHTYSIEKLNALACTGTVYAKTVCSTNDWWLNGFLTYNVRYIPSSGKDESTNITAGNNVKLIRPYIEIKLDTP